MNFKQQRLDVSMSELQNLQAALTNCENEIVAANEEYDNVGRELDEKSQLGITPSEVITYNAYLHSLIKKANQLQTKKMNIQSAIEAKKVEVVEFKTDLKGLEKVKDKQYKEYQKGEQKKAEQVIEELKSIDINTLSPYEAMTLLFNLQKRLKMGICFVSHGTLHLLYLTKRASIPKQKIFSICLTARCMKCLRLWTAVRNLIWI